MAAHVAQPDKLEDLEGRRSVRQERCRGAPSVSARVQRLHALVEEGHQHCQSKCESSNVDGRQVEKSLQ